MNAVVSGEEFFSVEPTPLVDGNVVSGTDFFDGESKPYVPESEPEKLGYLQRVGEDLETRVKFAREIRAAYQRGEQGIMESGMQLYGKVGAGAALDIMGETVVATLKAITPDIIEKPMIDAATYAYHEFLNTDIGKKGLDAALQGIDAYKQFKAENPRAARNIEAAVDLAVVLFPAMVLFHPKNRRANSCWKDRRCCEKRG